jgi:hypothetical protein
MQMNDSASRHSWLVLVATLLIPGCAAFRQTANEVTIREPGHRMLGKPLPIAPEATKHWEYAWLSEAAYNKTAGAYAKQAAKGIAPCANADEVLRAQGWERWAGFPDDGLLQKISVSNLRVEVWEKRTTQSVVVAFGGTIFTSGKDWKSNLRWFIPKHKDEYTEIVAVFGPAFVSEFQRRANAPEGTHLRGVSLYATGHSLGGGLAQQFAYALPINDAVPRVQHVYAFDPSPVTGFYSVAPYIRDINKVSLSIDRVYERGEILALVRSFTSFFVPPSASNPAIRGVRYNLFYTANPISGHSMSELACKLQAASGHAM